MAEVKRRRRRRATKAAKVEEKEVNENSVACWVAGCPNTQPCPKHGEPPPPEEEVKEEPNG
jgi:hypothetical protein